MGPFRYWTLAQIPNWLLAAPILVITIHWLFLFYRRNLQQILRKTFMPHSISNYRYTTYNTLTESLLPHVHYTTAVLLLLVVSSHVQILLRFASPGSLPVVWWAIAWNACDNNAQLQSRSRHVYIIISCLLLWNIVSIVLYAGFYPPA